MVHTWVSQNGLSSERSPVIMRYHELRYFDVLQQCCVLSMLTGSEPARSSLIGRLLAIVKGTLFILTKLLSANAVFLWPFFGCMLFLMMTQFLNKHTDIRETGFSDDFIAQTCNRSVLIERTCVYSEVCRRFDVPVANLIETTPFPADPWSYWPILCLLEGTRAVSGGTLLCLCLISSSGLATLVFAHLQTNLALLF